MVWTKKERRRTLPPHIFAVSCLLRNFWATMSLADHKGTQWENLSAQISFWGICEVIRLLLKYCVYCASAPSLHRDLKSTDSLIISLRKRASRLFCCLCGAKWSHAFKFCERLIKVPVRYRPNAASGGWGYGRDLFNAVKRGYTRLTSSH